MTLTLRPTRRPYALSPAYNASKAALHSYSDTLRVELSPFGVRVLVIATGGVKTNIARIDRTLPAGSYYNPIADVYKGRLTLSRQVGITNEAFAKSSVEKILAQGWWTAAMNLLSFGNRNRYLWEGSHAWLLWFVSGFMPRFILVSLLEAQR